MADILTHYTVSRMASIKMDARNECAVILGALMPDIISKAMTFMFQSGHYFGAFSHSLLGAVLYSALVVIVFVGEGSPLFFPCMLLGYLLHIAVDVFKDYLGFGSTFPFLPFSTTPVEVSLYNPFDSVYIIPVDIILLLMIISYRKKRRKW